MLNLTTLLSAMGALIVIAGLVVMIVGLRRAPVAFEDASGFHFGKEHDTTIQSNPPVKANPVPAVLKPLISKRNRRVPHRGLLA